MVTLQHVCSQMSEKPAFIMFPYSTHQTSARYMSHIKPATLTLGEMVGKVCDLEGDSRLLRDLAAQPALSPAPVLVFGGS